jgi:hypothetical protein
MLKTTDHEIHSRGTRYDFQIRKTEAQHALTPSRRYIGAYHPEHRPNNAEDIRVREAGLTVVRPAGTGRHGPLKVNSI